MKKPLCSPVRVESSARDPRGLQSVVACALGPVLPLSVSRKHRFEFRMGYRVIPLGEIVIGVGARVRGRSDARGSSTALAFQQLTASLVFGEGSPCRWEPDSRAARSSAVGVGILSQHATLRSRASSSREKSHQNANSGSTTLSVPSAPSSGTTAGGGLFDRLDVSSSSRRRSYNTQSRPVGGLHRVERDTSLLLVSNAHICRATGLVIQAGG